MALDVVITTDRITRDPIGRGFIDHVQEDAQSLGLDDATLYYDFPLYSDYETVAHKPDVLLISRRHGIVAVRFVHGEDANSLTQTALAAVDESLNQFCSILIGRLLKSRPLRKDRSSLIFDVTPVVYMPGARGAIPTIDSDHVTSLAGLDEFLADANSDPFSEDVFAEARSVIEGAKALTRPQRRIIENPAVQTQAAALAKLEAEIANFDQRQRHAALVKVPSPQRIRGLAGSGKTVILAMKAAHLHLTNPAEHILFTFWTRSLRSPIRTLITRFYRHYRDEDPDWQYIHIRHGWGGASSAGVYADAARRHGRVPLTLTAAKQAAGGGNDPFDFACRDLLKGSRVEPYYDHTLIDERGGPVRSDSLAAWLS